MLLARVSRRCFLFVQAIAFDSRHPLKGFISSWYIVIDLFNCQLCIPFPFANFCLELNCECVLLLFTPVARLPQKGYCHIFVS